MNHIYLDFEATQFKENIIAIGATCECGSFDCLVQPPKGDKITKFITELTGITPEMAEYALSPDEAFTDLFSWICQVSQNNLPTFFHVYGNMDKTFLHNTAKYIEDKAIKVFVEDLADSVIDDSNKVCRFFHTRAIGVHKALKYFDSEISEQDHDPLNDAILLYNLMNHVLHSEPLEKCPFEEKRNIFDKNGEVIKQKPFKIAPQTIITARHINEKNAKIKQFQSFDLAAKWVIQKVKSRSPEALSKNIRRNLRKAIENNSNYISYNWKGVA